MHSLLGGLRCEGMYRERKVAVEVGRIRIFLFEVLGQFGVCHLEGVSPGMFVRMAINGMADTWKMEWVD